jgi:type II secretion system (T2SS) protein B
LSSILDALNKLEKEVSPQDYPPAHARAGGKVFIPKSTFLIIGVVCLCIGTIGFVIFYQRDTEKTPQALIADVGPKVTSGTRETTEPEVSVDEQKPMPVSPQKAPSPLPSMLQDLESIDSAGRPETVLLNDSAITKPKPPGDENDTDEIVSESRPLVESKKESIEKPLLDRESQEPESPVSTTAKDTSDSIDAPSKEMATQKEKPLQMDRLEGVGLRIQAISWGDVPQERLVVINNQVLHEGESIEGYQISQINPDDIVLRRGGNAYQLDFSLKGAP